MDDLIRVGLCRKFNDTYPSAISLAECNIPFPSVNADMTFDHSPLSRSALRAECAALYAGSKLFSFSEALKPALRPDGDFKAFIERCAYGMHSHHEVFYGLE